EAIEVVDVHGPEVDLQRVEDVRQRDAELLRLHSVDVGVQLRGRGTEGAEHPGNLRIAARRADVGVGRLLQRAEALPGAILDEELEPARGAEALHGDRKSTRLNSSHVAISYAVFCLKKKKNKPHKHDIYLQPH